MRCLTARPAPVSQPSWPISPRSRKSVGHLCDLRSGQVVETSELRCGQSHVERDEDVRFEAADVLDHQRGDVSVTAVFTQQ